MINRIQIKTPSRLHFGLLGWGEDLVRQFGGIGLMIEEPGLEIVAEPATRWTTEGPLADRTLEITNAVAKQLADRGTPASPLRITNVQVPEAHIGLGVGTQLSLAVTRALTESAGLHQTPVATLAELTGRGRRSGVGIHGFGEGGLIVDAGRREGNDVPTKLVRLSFPADWSIMIVLPERSHGLHGAEEIDAFRSIPRIPEATSNRLCRLILLGILPAVIENDLSRFGTTLGEMQRIVGNTFAPAQGGRFKNTRIQSIAERMTGLGLHGVGQSSWGPTLYGFSTDDNLEREMMSRTLADEYGLGPRCVLWTKANNKGSVINFL